MTRFNNHSYPGRPGEYGFEGYPHAYPKRLETLEAYAIRRSLQAPTVDGSPVYTLEWSEPCWPEANRLFLSLTRSPIPHLLIW